MTFWKYLALVSIIASPGFALAQAPRAAPLCREGLLVITDELKEMAYRREQGELDDSAPRATMRGAQDGASVAVIQANLYMLQAAHCALPALPVDPSLYINAASPCVLAKSPADVDKFCDRAAWKVGPRWEAGGLAGY